MDNAEYFKLSTGASIRQRGLGHSYCKSVESRVVVEFILEDKLRKHSKTWSFIGSITHIKEYTCVDKSARLGIIPQVK